MTGVTISLPQALAGTRNQTSMRMQCPFGGPVELDGLGGRGCQRQSTLLHRPRLHRQRDLCLHMLFLKEKHMTKEKGLCLNMLFSKEKP